MMTSWPKPYGGSAHSRCVAGNYRSPSGSQTPTSRTVARRVPVFRAATEDQHDGPSCPGLLITRDPACRIAIELAEPQAPLRMRMPVAQIGRDATALNVGQSDLILLPRAVGLEAMSLVHGIGSGPYLEHHLNERGILAVAVSEQDTTSLVRKSPLCLALQFIQNCLRQKDLNFLHDSRSAHALHSGWRTKAWALHSGGRSRSSPKEHTKTSCRSSCFSSDGNSSVRVWAATLAPWAMTGRMSNPAPTKVAAAQPRGWTVSDAFRAGAGIVSLSSRWCCRHSQHPVMPGRTLATRPPRAPSVLET